MRSVNHQETMLVSGGANQKDKGQSLVGPFFAIYTGIATVTSSSLLVQKFTGPVAASNSYQNIAAFSLVVVPVLAFAGMLLGAAGYLALYPDA